MRSARWSLAAGIVGLTVLSYLYFPESIDDAYITLRFSKNLLLGNGPVFNVGERVEGYSNFTWMALLAVLGRLGAPMEVAMKVVGLGASLCTLVLVWRLAREWFTSAAAVGTATLLLGGSSFFAVWSVDGLETGFYTLLVTGLAWALTRAGVNGLLVGVLGGIVCLTRPEGALFALGSVAYLTARQGLRPGALALAIVGTCAGAYEVFRYVYFGELVSNSALLKLHPGVESATRGVLYLLSFNSASGYAILPAALAAAIAARKRWQLWVPIIFLLAQVLFLLLSGGDYMYGYRFVVPVLAALALLCGAGVDLVEERGHRGLALGISVVLTIGTCVVQYTSLPRKHLGLDNLTFRSAPHFDVARLLAQHSTASDTVVVSEAGIMPYYIDARVVDYLGLVSPVRSIFGPGRSVDTQYVFAAQPKLVVLSFVERPDGSITPRLPMDADINACAEFRRAYSPLRSFDIPRGESFLDEIYYLYSPGATRIFFTVFARRAHAGR